MIFRDIAVRVVETVQDSSLTGDANLLHLFDRCVKELAQRLDFSALITTDEVAVLAAGTTATLPDDYLRNILAAYDSDTLATVAVVSPAKMWSMYPAMDAEGDAVAYLAVHGAGIIVQPAPSEEVDITIRYMSAPDEVDDLDDTVPAWIAPSEQHNIFYHFACKELYAQLEDGADGAKTNTAYHETKWHRSFNTIAYLERINGHEALPGDFSA